MRFFATVLLFTAVSAGGVEQAINHMSEEELDLMALQLKNAAAAKKMGAKPKDCSAEMMKVYDKFIAQHEANHRAFAAGVAAKGKAYPGELNKFESDANKFLSEAEKHTNASLSDAKVATTRKEQDEFFKHVNHGLKVGLKQERENSAVFFKGYGVAYDAGYKVWKQKKSGMRKTVNNLADSVETLGAKHDALVKLIENKHTAEGKAVEAAWKDFGEKFGNLMKKTEEYDKARWAAADKAVKKELKMDNLKGELEHDIKEVEDNMELAPLSPEQAFEKFKAQQKKLRGDDEEDTMELGPLSPDQLREMFKEAQQKKLRAHQKKLRGDAEEDTMELGPMSPEEAFEKFKAQQKKLRGDAEEDTMELGPMSPEEAFEKFKAQQKKMQDKWN